jgi:hypothetical protein
VVDQPFLIGGDDSLDAVSQVEFREDAAYLCPDQTEQAS